MGVDSKPLDFLFFFLIQTKLSAHCLLISQTHNKKRTKVNLLLELGVGLTEDDIFVVILF